MIFKGIKVVDFTNTVAGPSCTMYLADMGAEVYKIEKQIGDDSRGFGPFVDGDKSLTFISYNRGKKSVILDFNNPQELELIRSMIDACDVVVESFRPGVMKKFGLDYETLSQKKPDLIMCSISAFGQDGPYHKKAGYDLLTQAISGLMDNTGEAGGPPTKIGSSISDFFAGLSAFAAISAALYKRAVTNEGEYIDIALFDSVFAYNENIEGSAAGYALTRSGNHHAQAAPYGIFHGNRGSIFIGAINDKLWKIFCKVINRPDLLEKEGWENGGKRRAVLPQVIEVIEAWLRTFENVEIPLKLLDEAGIPCGKVKSNEDCLVDPQLIHRGMIHDLEVPFVPGGRVTSRGSQFKFLKNPVRLGSVPDLGQHQEEVLALFKK